MANGATMSIAAQSAVYLGFCSLLTDTVFQQGANIIDHIVPSEITQRFAAMNVDIVQNLTTGIVYAIGGRYFRVSPMDDMATAMGILRSVAYGTTIASASEVITKTTGL